MHLIENAWCHQQSEEQEEENRDDRNDDYAHEIDDIKACWQIDRDKQNETKRP